MASWWNDFQNNSLSGQSFFPDAQVSTFFGAGVDMKEAELGLFALLDIGNVTGTNPTLDVKLQESDDDGVSDPYTDVNDFKTGGVAAFAQATTSLAISSLTFKRSKRFVRAFATIGGTSPSFTMSVSLHGLLKAVRKFGDPVS